MTQTVVGYDTEFDCDEPMAREIVHNLCTTYPGHGWFVVVKGGVVHVKDMDINPQWGMCLHYSQMKDDATERKKQVIRAAGEFLERANLARGAKSADQRVTAVDGIPQKQLARMGAL